MPVRAAIVRPEPPISVSSGPADLELPSTPRWSECESRSLSMKTIVDVAVFRGDEQVEVGIEAVKKALEYDD